MFASAKGKQQKQVRQLQCQEQSIDHIPYYLSGLSHAHFSDNLSRNSCIRFSSTFSQQSFNSKRVQYSRYNLRSSDGIVLVDSSIRTKKTLGDKAFSTAAPKVWNNFPLHIRNEKNFNLYHLRSCARTIILKQLVTQLPERTFPGFPQRISISIRTYARTEWHT